MAKKKRPAPRHIGKLLAMDMATETERELVGTTEAAKILGINATHVRQLARDNEIWSDTRFGKRCPVYDAVELRERAERISADRAAGKRPGRPPSGGQQG